MAERLLLVDTDIFVLLAASNLLFEFFAALEFDTAQVRRLPPVAKQLQPNKSIGRMLLESQREDAIAATKVVAPLVARPSDFRLLELLQGMEDIDPGEALLFATLAENPSYLLVTGDKRSLRTLGSTESLASIRTQVSGRILPYERVLLNLFQKLGAAVVGSRLKPLSAYHRTTDILFGTKVAFDEAECRRQVDSYYQDLQKACGEDLFFRD